MDKGGRPTKLTDELQEEFLKVIRSGNYIETACAYVGLSKNTVYDWMKRGAREKERASKMKKPKFYKRELPYVEFSDAIEKALAHSEVRDVAIIGKAAAENWQAAAWRLERKFPKKWGRKEQVSAEVKTEHSGEVVNKNESDISITHKIEEYEEVYEKIAERGQVESDHESDDS